MGYALFAQRKIVLDAQLNMYQLQQTQRSNDQFRLASRTQSLQQQLSSIQAAQAGELAVLYNDLASSDSTTRNSINAEINAMEERFEQELQTINNKIYQVSIKENAIEMEVKHLDTLVEKIQKELEAVEKAESTGIEGSVPKYSGNG